MKKRILTAIVAVALFVAVMPLASALSLSVDGRTVQNVTMYNGTTYVPIRSATELLSPGASVSWENGQAVIRSSSLNLTARPGDCYLQANGRILYAAEDVKLVNGSTLVPIRALATALGGTVNWDGRTQKVTVYSGSGTIQSGEQFYNSSDVYWLSRIINAESSGEPMKGKIAVGNVILNRVASPSFPNTIYDVIFDTNGGTQFQPVANGAINATPSNESVIAAKLCLDGASVAANSLFFLNPAIATSSWISNNRPFVTSIGNHYFYA